MITSIFTYFYLPFVLALTPPQKNDTKKYFTIAPYVIGSYKKDSKKPYEYKAKFGARAIYRNPNSKFGYSIDSSGKSFLKGSTSINGIYYLENGLYFSQGAGVELNKKSELIDMSYLAPSRIGIQKGPTFIDIGKTHYIDPTGYNLGPTELRIGLKFEF